MKSKTFLMMSRASIALSAMLMFTQVGCQNGKEKPKPHDNSNIPDLPGAEKNKTGKDVTEPPPAKKEE